MSSSSSSSNNSSKRKDIVSLDDDPPPAKKVNNTNEEPIIHKYFEPKEYCNFTIIYQNYHIHCHKCDLVRQSNYFRALLEEKEIESITIPHLTTQMSNRAITVTEYYQFFSRLFSTDMRWYSNVILDIEFHLTDYFNCSVYTNFLSTNKEVLLSKLKVTPTILDMFCLIEIYKAFSDWKEYILSIVAANLHTIRNGTDEAKIKWNKLSIELRETILEKRLSILPKHMLITRDRTVYYCICGYTNDNQIEICRHLSP